MSGATIETNVDEMVLGMLDFEHTTPCDHEHCHPDSPEPATHTMRTRCCNFVVFLCTDCAETVRQMLREYKVECACGKWLSRINVSIRPIE